MRDTRTGGTLLNRLVDPFLITWEWLIVLLLVFCYAGTVALMVLAETTWGRLGILTIASGSTVALVDQLFRVLELKDERAGFSRGELQ